MGLTEKLCRKNKGANFNKQFIQVCMSWLNLFDGVKVKDLDNEMCSPDYDFTRGSC